MNDISLTTLYNYLRNPYKQIKNIRLASKYFTNKYGVIKDVLRSFKSLPVLNYHLAWSSFDNPKQVKKYEKKVFDFLRTINIRKVVRDGLYELGEQGTIVLCLRKQKYIQFLELDDLRIHKQINGKWVVEYDLASIKQIGMSVHDIVDIIESLPEEISLVEYNKYRKDPSDKNRYIELKNCWVIALDAPRNYPFGMPLSLGSWASLIQMEIINRVERSVADRLIKQILILYSYTLNPNTKDNIGQPVPKETIEFYFNSIKSLLLKKENTNMTSNSGDMSGTGLMTLPYFFKLEPLQIDTTMFKKELYKKLQDDIFMNLGISQAIIYGGGESSNYSSAELNSRKFFRQINSILELFEDVFNEMIAQLLPKSLSCNLFFIKTTVLNNKEYVNQCKDIYLQTGLVAPWLESVLGVPYIYAVGMKKYQDLLGLDKIFNPPLNFYTQGKDVGRPETDNPKGPTQSTKTTGGNDLPSPSD